MRKQQKNRQKTEEQEYFKEVIASLEYASDCTDWIADAATIFVNLVVKDKAIQKRIDTLISTVPAIQTKNVVEKYLVKN